MAKKKTKKKTTKNSAQKIPVKKSGAKTHRRIVDKKRDSITTKKIEDLATSIVKQSLAQKEPTFEIPTRSISNMTYNKKKRILEMGSNTQTRSLFNLGQSRKFLQSLLLAKGCRDLIDAEKTLSLRGMYYMGLHTIPGTKEKTFNDQGESDGILEDLEVSLDGLREELHIFAKKRGTMVGNITGKWAVADMPFQAFVNRMSCNLNHAKPILFCTLRKIQFGVDSTKIVFGKPITAF
jgi:DNA topoisomerase-6 subunit A